MAGITVYSTRFCGDCVRSKWTLDERNIEFDEVDIDADPSGEQVVLKVNRGSRSVPTIVFPDGSTLTEPNSRELLNRLKDLGLVD